MRIPLRCVVVVLALVTFVTKFSSRVSAEGLERIRPEASSLKTAVATAFERSATFRSIVERINESDVIVYMTCGYFKSVLMAGRTVLVLAGPDVRYVRVQILCEQSAPALVSIVAHELQHVAELAAAPSVIDERSFASLFRAIGYPSCLWAEYEQFETAAAVDTGRQVTTEVRRYTRPAALALRQVAAPVPASGH
jgi:hypothetical protein